MAELARVRNTTKRYAIALGMIVCALVVWLGLERSGAFADPPAPTAAPSAGATASPAPAPATSAASTPGSAAAASATVQITFSTVPPSNATVTWGSTRLGRITPGRPLVVKRPRDSGPLDVVVRTGGYLPVQTRAHTFEDTRVSVKLTQPALKNTLLGYRAPLDAGLPFEIDLQIEMGAPPPPSTAPAAPTVQPPPPTGTPVSP